MRRSIFIALALLTILIWTSEIPAASWDFIYEGDKIPDDPALGNKVWKVFKTNGIKTSDVSEITPEQELHITDPADKVCFFMQEVKSAEKATVEARVKVLSQSGVGHAVLLAIEEPNVVAWLGLFPDRIELLKFNARGLSHNVDMTEYHILRIAKDGNDVTIYVDDKKVIEGQVGDTQNRTGIIFGAGSVAGTGEHYWDYVVFTTADALSPKELPSLQSSTTTTVSPQGKLTTTWGEIKRR